MAFITSEEMNKMCDEIIKKEGIGGEEFMHGHEEFMRLADEIERQNKERKAREQSRQMMGAGDVAAALVVSKSTTYQIIRRLNKELEKAGYITIRGKISRAYFEKRTYGVGASVS